MLHSSVLQPSKGSERGRGKGASESCCRHHRLVVVSWPGMVFSLIDEGAGSEPELFIIFRASRSIGAALLLILHMQSSAPLSMLAGWLAISNTSLVVWYGTPGKGVRSLEV